jgi:hypothetical protein
LLRAGGVNVFHSLRFGSPRFVELSPFADRSVPRVAELFVSLLADAVSALDFPPEALEDVSRDLEAPRDSIALLVPLLRPPAVTALT